MQKPEPVKRKLFFAAVGWLSGLAVFGASFSITLKLLAAAGAFSAAALLRRKRYAVLVLAAMCCAIVYGSVYSAAAERPAQKLAGREVAMTGIVTECRRVSDGMVRIKVKGRIAGGTYAKVGFLCVGDISQGDEVTVRGTVIKPEKTATFDGENYNRSMGIFLSGNGVSDCEKTGRRNMLYTLAGKARDYVVGRIYELCPGQGGAFLAAMLCSEKSGLDADTKNAVYRAGLGHLFAVSGTHVVMICAFLAEILSVFISSERRRSAVMLAIIWGFAVFAGLSPSVVRACVMMSISLTAVFFGRRSDSANSLGAAALLLTRNCPYVIYSVSFVMSFAAAFAFSVVSPAVCKGRVKGKYSRRLISYMCIFMVSMPFCAYYFSEISVVSAAANLLLIDICSAALTAVFLFAITGCMLSPIMYGAGFAAEFIIMLCKMLTGLPLAYVGTEQAGYLMLVGGAAIAVISYYALTKHRSSRQMLRFGAFYVTLCIAVELTLLIPTEPSAYIYPRGKHCAVLIDTGSAVIIADGSTKGRESYALARKAEQLHRDEIYLLIDNDDTDTAERYADELGGGISACISDNDGIAEHYDDKSELGGAVAKHDGEGWVIGLDDSSVGIYGDRIVLDGKEYRCEGFTAVSEYRLGS